MERGLVLLGKDLRFLGGGFEGVVLVRRSRVMEPLVPLVSLWSPYPFGLGTSSKAEGTLGTVGGGVTLRRKSIRLSSLS